MAKCKVIQIDIYGLSLVVFVGSIDELRAFAEDRNKHIKADRQVMKDIRERLDNAVGFEASTYWNGETRALLVYLPSLSLKPKNINNAVHELAHAPFLVLDNVGIPTTEDNSEAFAYLQGWLAMEVFEKKGYEEV